MTKTFTQTAQQVLKNNKAFSLLEIVIVLSIMGAIIGIALPRLTDKKIDTRKVMREFAVAGKDLKSRAKLSGTTYRLAFQLDPVNAQSWWVEKSSQATLIDKKKLEAEREAQKEAQAGKSAEGPAPAFQPDLSIFKKKQTLPSGFTFVHIESGTQDLILTEGVAYIHFFPQGLIESSAIQIQDHKKNIWTLVYNPITGYMDVIPEAKVLKDLAR